MKREPRVTRPALGVVDAVWSANLTSAVWVWYVFLWHFGIRYHLGDYFKGHQTGLEIHSCSLRPAFHAGLFISIYHSLIWEWLLWAWLDLKSFEHQLQSRTASALLSSVLWISLCWLLPEVGGGGAVSQCCNGFIFCTDGQPSAANTSCKAQHIGKKCLSAGASE